MGLTAPWRHASNWNRKVFSLCLILGLLFLTFTAPRLSTRSFIQHSSLKQNDRGSFAKLTLTEAECTAAFPGLTDDIDHVVSLGPFTLERQKDDSILLEVRIKNGQLYILHSESSLTPELYDSQTATLHQIHRAILTSPEPLPDTIIALSIRDQPFGASWTYSRPAYAMLTANGPPITRVFLMPHFSLWAWPQPFIGSMSRAAAAIDGIEGGMAFSEKDPRAAWRGTVGFNSPHHPKLREDLLRVTKGKGWADVQALEWLSDNEKGGGNGTVPVNAMMVEDFCRYKYVIYTEGVTYSGRLQFLQMCRSVLIAPPVAWLQHTTHLVRPVFSSDLLGSQTKGMNAAGEDGVRQAWPRRYEPEEANAVFVRSDWEGLEDTVLWLEEHPDVAEGIARRQRELFVGGGYFSPAAEVCYWRALIRGWAGVVRVEEGREGGGMPWEQFVLGQHQRG